MAHVAFNNNGNTNFSTTTPFMDQLTHAVIKETSKNLRYYIDVKRRENGFVLSPNAPTLDSIPLKARFMYGTTKEYPPLYASYHSDTDVKVYLPTFQNPRRQSNSTAHSVEKQMCREELNYHMYSQKYSPRENQKFGELHLRSRHQSSSSCSRTSSRDFQRRIPKSAYKLSRREQNQLVDDTADILATMVKARRTIYETNFLSQHIPPTYISRNANPSPRQTDNQSTSSSSTHPSSDLRQTQKQKPMTENLLEKSATIMRNAKPITRGLLCEYKVSVTTGNCNGASTNAPVRIQLYGTNGYTNFLDLVDSETHRIPFLKAQTDVFNIQTYHVGQLGGITIGHDRKDTRSGWSLNKVSIDDPIRETTFEIPCNAWLSSKSDDQKTMRDFYVASMIPHKKHIYSHKHREKIDRRSSSSSATNEGTTTSSTTNRSLNDKLIDYKRTKKQQRVSIGPTTVARKPTSLTEITNHLSQPPPATTVESHFSPHEFSPPPVPARRTRSPIISPSSSSSSDTEIENHVVNHTHPITPTQSPTLDQTRVLFDSDSDTSQTPDKTKYDLLNHHSTNHNRPPARLEKRSSPVSVSAEQPIKNKEETNGIDSFFD